MELGHQRLELGLSDGVGMLAVQRLAVSASVLLMGPRVETEVTVPARRESREEMWREEKRRVEVPLAAVASVSLEDVKSRP